MDSSMQKLSLFCGRGAERQSKYRETFFVDRPRCRWCSGPCISQILMAMVPFERTDQNLLEYQISKLNMAVVRLTNVYKLCSFAGFFENFSGKLGLKDWPPGLWNIGRFNCCKNNKCRGNHCAENGTIARQIHDIARKLQAKWQEICIFRETGNYKML